MKNKIQKNSINGLQKKGFFKYSILSFLFIGIIVYFPVFFNGFVWDDTGYIVGNPQVQKLNFTTFFDTIFNSEYIYRQIPVLYYSFLYSLFGQNPFPYHLFELLLHITACSLIFLLLKKYFSTKISYLLSIIFLIHPINAETAIWISSSQTQLYTIFGLISLLIAHNKNLNSKQIRLLTLCLFLSIMSYELGILYFLMTSLYLYITKSVHLKRIILYELGAFTLYLILRFLGNSLNFHALQELTTHPTLAQTIWTMPSIIAYYIKTLIFPEHLMIWQNWQIKDVSLVSFIIPAISIQLTIIIYIWLFTHLKKGLKSTFLFFTLWLVLGMIPLLQLIPLLMTVADRWFYFPFIGLLGLVGVIITQYHDRIIKYKKIILILFIIVVTLYSLRTFYRTFDWKDNITLFSHDLQYEPNHFHLNNNLAVLYFQSGNYRKAIPYLEKIAYTPPYKKMAFVYLGLIYTREGDDKKASDYFQKAIDETSLPRISNGVDNYYLLAQSHLKLHEYTKISGELTDEIIASSPQKDDLLLIRAEAYYYLHRFEDADKDMRNISKKVYDLRVSELQKKIKEEL